MKHHILCTLSLLAIPFKANERKKNPNQPINFNMPNPQNYYAASAIKIPFAPQLPAFAIRKIYALCSLILQILPALSKHVVVLSRL